MLMPRLPAAALLLSVGAAYALQDASPFFLISSNPLPPTRSLTSTQIAASHEVEDGLIAALAECDKRWYYIFSQNGVSADDFHSVTGYKKVRGLLSEVDGSRLVDIPHVGVGGELDAEHIKSRLQTACEAKGKKMVENEWPTDGDQFRIVHMTMPELPSDPVARAKAVSDTDDALIDTVSSVVAGEQPSVFIYITSRDASSSPPDTDHYDTKEPSSSAPHRDLKRDLNVHRRQSNSSDSMQASLPLFEKYQFLSPALFMGLTVALLLISILWVGVSAIAGLDVSYMAFNKEMGPQAQNKGKQQ